MSDHTAQFSTPIALDRDMFMRRLIASLGHLNEGILGSDVAGAYIMNVGLSMGAAIEAEYKRFWDINRPFTLDEYAHVIVDLKQKIQGNFSIVSKAATHVVVRTTSCPFDEMVRQSPSLCFMTSSVFGGIAARNFDYAKVVLHKRIALGDPDCYVTVHLQRTPEAEAAIGREYTPDIDQSSPDIAEQLRLMDRVRRLHRRLSEVSTRWNVLVHSAAEAICIIGPDGRIAFANAQWRELLGVEGAELIGAQLEQIVHADDQAQVGKSIAGALTGQPILGQALRLRHRDTSWRDTLISLSPLRDETGGLIGALVLAHDVTEAREVQRLKDEFLSTTAHEIRTPVTTIRGLTDLLLRRIERQGQLDPAQLVKHLQTIRREADRLTFLGADLLDVARLQQGRLGLQREPHDLLEIVRESVARQEAIRIAPVTHRFDVQYPSGAVTVNVERRRIEQILANLFENAVKYSPESSSVTVMVELDQDQARVSVTDEGIGIAEHELKKLGTPFYRASNATVQNYPGLGLGLYFSKAIAEAHGGELTIRSRIGQDTTVTLVLPVIRTDGEPGTAV